MAAAVGLGRNKFAITAAPLLFSPSSFAIYCGIPAQTAADQRRSNLKMTALDEIAQERQRIAERLARLDSDRAKLAEQLGELEIAERVLSRFDKVETGIKRRRGRPAPSASKPVARQLRSPKQPAQGLSLSDATLRAVQQHPEGLTAADVMTFLTRELGMSVRPNHLGIALQRHRRAGRLDNRDRLWFPPQSASANEMQPRT